MLRESSAESSPSVEPMEANEGSGSKKSRLVKLNLSELGKKKWHLPIGLHSQIKKSAKRLPPL